MRHLTILLLCVFAISLQACSKSEPVTCDQSSLMTSEVGYPSIAGSGKIILDPSGTASIEPDREPAFHYNITGYLTGWCPGGCLKIRVLNISGELWTIEITITNPTSIQVYDTRVVYYDTAGKTVMNPDGYLAFYSRPMSPYTAFAKEYSNRAYPLGPGGSDSENLILNWPAGQPMYVGYYVDVSVGGNCPEAYLVETEVSNEIPSSGGSAIVSARVYDWQGSANRCFCDWSSLGGTISEMSLVGSGTGFSDFEYEINTSDGLSPGDYTVMVAMYETLSQGVIKSGNTATVSVVESQGVVKLSDSSYVTSLNFTSKTVAAYGNEVYVAWADNSNISNRHEIFLKEFSSGVWQDPVRVSQQSSDTSSFANPSIAINTVSGDLHFIWEGMVDSNMSVSYRSRKGKTWNEPQVLFQGAFCMDSQIDVEDNNKIHIVFQDSDGPFLCIYWIHDNGSGIFQTPMVIAEALSPMDPYYAPAIDHDHMGYVHVPFMTGFNGMNNVAYKMYNGSYWSGLSWLTNDQSSYYPDITVAPNRKATMIYQKDDTDLWSKAWTGTWEYNEHRVTTNASIYGIPNCDADSNGNIHLAYVGQSDGDKDIYYMVYSETLGVWSTPENLSNNTSDSKDPSLFVGSGDKVHIVWSDNADGNYAVFYIRL